MSQPSDIPERDPLLRVSELIEELASLEPAIEKWREARQILQDEYQALQVDHRQLRHDQEDLQSEQAAQRESRRLLMNRIESLESENRRLNALLKRYNRLTGLSLLPSLVPPPPVA